MANIRSFNLSWQGSAGASASGSITIDTDLVTFDVPDPPAIPISAVQSLTVTVSGAPAGNGVYGKSDFTELRFYSRAPLNFSQQLVGQAQGDYPSFGTLNALGNAGDFNLVGQGVAPDGVAAFTLVTNGKQDPNALLTISSIAPA